MATSGIKRRCHVGFFRKNFLYYFEGSTHSKDSSQAWLNPRFKISK